MLELEAHEATRIVAALLVLAHRTLVPYSAQRCTEMADEITELIREVEK